MATQDTTRDRQPGDAQQPDRAESGDGRGRLRRAITLLIGGVLVVRGLRRRSLRGLVMALAGGVVLGRALGVSPSRSDSESAAPMGAGESTEVTRSITIGEPAQDLYEAWRDPETMSKIMGHFADVQPQSEDRLQWTVQGPRGWDASWETRIVDEQPGESIVWRSPADAMVPNEGEVRFSDAPGDRGTEVTLTISFDPPGGSVGSAAARRLDLVPEAIAGKALSRFKSLVESGEIPSLDENPSARGSGDLV